MTILTDSALTLLGLETSCDETAASVVRRDANAVVQTAYLEPAIDLDKLEYLLVITNYQGGLPPANQQPTSQTNPDGTLPDSEQPFITPSPSPSSSPSSSPSKKP